MPSYLVTGGSGTGKSTICRELVRRGCRAVETDNEFGYYGNIETEEPVDFPFEDVTEQWYRENGWLWDGAALERDIRSSSENSFYCGGAINQSKFYHLFNASFLLVVDKDTLIERITGRAGDTHTTNLPKVEQTLRFLASAESYAQRHSLILLDTAQSSVEGCVDFILRHAATFNDPG